MSLGLVYNILIHCFAVKAGFYSNIVERLPIDQVTCAQLETVTGWDFPNLPVPQWHPLNLT